MLRRQGSKGVWRIMRPASAMTRFSCWLGEGSPQQCRDLSDRCRKEKQVGRRLEVGWHVGEAGKGRCAEQKVGLFAPVCVSCQPPAAINPYPMTEVV